MVGKLQRHAMAFLAKYPNEWHSYSKDSTTRRVVTSLNKQGLVEINEFHQFRLAPKCKVTKTHTDGDLTLKCKDAKYIVTTSGETFKQVKK